MQLASQNGVPCYRWSFRIPRTCICGTRSSAVAHYFTEFSNSWMAEAEATGHKKKGSGDELMERRLCEFRHLLAPAVFSFPRIPKKNPKNRRGWLLRVVAGRREHDVVTTWFESPGGSRKKGTHSKHLRMRIQKALSHATILFF